jgi:Protein of unknown function (DUF3043)
MRSQRSNPAVYPTVPPRSNLANVKLLGGRKDEGATGDQGDDSTLSSASDASRTTQTTAPKGRPTPPRSAGRKGPVAPAPMTGAEARARRKSLKGPKLDREERRAQTSERRAQQADRRERMMAGDERYLLTRDQGPVRRYVRDVVDARRNVLGLFLPSAVALMSTMLLPQLQLYASPAMLVLMAVMLVDGLILGRKVARLVDEKFPEDTESRWKLGLYATSRASQTRRMRTPRPQVKHGASVD